MIGPLRVQWYYPWGPERETLKRRLFAALLISVAGLASCTAGQTRTETQTVTQTTTLTQTTTREIPTTVTVTQTATQTITTTATVTVTINPVPTDHRYEIIDPIAYQITQQTSTYWYFAWNISIKNLDTADMQLMLTINFIDKDGIVLHSDNQLTTIGAGQIRTVFGQTMIPADKAVNIISANSFIEFA